jgi:hypothetical protein
MVQLLGLQDHLMLARWKLNRAKNRRSEPIRAGLGLRRD